jgi:hypothetical protein
VVNKFLVLTFLSAFVKKEAHAALLYEAKRQWPNQNKLNRRDLDYGKKRGNPGAGGKTRERNPGVGRKA